jgi:hypothetical protein
MDTARDTIQDTWLYASSMPAILGPERARPGEQDFAELHPKEQGEAFVPNG